MTWAPAKQTATEVSFHIVTEARLNKSTFEEFKIVQKFCDGLSIRAGTDPGDLQYKMTIFKMDKDESVPASPSSCVYDDKPGYDSTHGLAADTDLMYVFGARWEVLLGKTKVAVTTPLFGCVTGADHRVYSPSAPVVATWDQATEAWNNQGALAGAFPAWSIYPVPATDNT